MATLDLLVSVNSKSAAPVNIRTRIEAPVITSNCLLKMNVQQDNSVDIKLLPKFFAGDKES